MEFRKHLIRDNESVTDALKKLNVLGIDAILFVVDNNGKLLGSMTDGDIRRGFIKGLDLHDTLTSFIQPNPVFIRQGQYAISEIEDYRKRNLKVVPILDEFQHVVDVANLRLRASMLPVEAVIMAGGKGERLLPLTKDCPKPMLKVGDKPIIEHNVDRLIYYGIDRIVISVRYLGDQIRQYFGNGEKKETTIEYVEEDMPLGTFGALSLIDGFSTDDILLMNSDLLTNINYADFFKSFQESNADFMVASIPYQVKVPYAVLQIDNGNVISFDEKPTYSYYSNGGIYLFKKSLLSYLIKGAFCDATDFMDLIIREKKRVVHYPILGYWLDIGKPQDFIQAQEDIKHISF